MLSKNGKSNVSIFSIFISLLSLIFSATAILISYNQYLLQYKTIPAELKFIINNNFTEIYNDGGITLDFDVTQILLLSFFTESYDDNRKLCPLIISDPDAKPEILKTNAYSNELLGKIFYNLDKKNLFTDKIKNLKHTAIFLENYFKITYKTINGVKISLYYKIIRNANGEMKVTKINRDTWTNINQIKNEIQSQKNKIIENAFEVIDYTKIYINQKNNKFYGCYNFSKPLGLNLSYYKNENLINIYNSSKKNN